MTTCFEGLIPTLAADAVIEQDDAAKGAGKKDFYPEWKPFDSEEIMAGCGLLLRAGAPCCLALSLDPATWRASPFGHIYPRSGTDAPNGALVPGSEHALHLG